MCDCIFFISFLLVLFDTALNNLFFKAFLVAFLRVFASIFCQQSIPGLRYTDV